MECVACGGPLAGPPLRVRERMLGLGDEFDYLRCEGCGSLQIAAPPADMGRYYDRQAYYSFSHDPSRAYRSRPRAVLKRLVDRLLLSPLHGVAAWALRRRMPEYVHRFAALRRVPLRRSTAMLDVGCGMGHLLYSLREIGFRHLRGLDPFLPESLTWPNGLAVERRHLAEDPGRYGLVLLDHALEHMPDPVDTLRQVRDRLGPGGTCLVRVPTVDSEAFDRYGAHWVQLDAPRHLHLPSREGLARMAARARLRVERVVDDSTGFQFWGSERYRQGLPLGDPATGRVAPVRSAALEAEARVLNRRQRGDQISAYLRQA